MRWWRLDRLPPGLQFDEAYNALDATAVIQGRWAVFFPANGGREPLLTYLQAPLLAALGGDAAMLALRFTCALVAILTVAATYRALSGLWDSHWIGLLGAGYLTASYWHLHFSRYGIRAILAPLWASTAVALWWQITATQPHRQVPAADRRAWLRVALLGAVLALFVYSHPTGRLFPLVLVAHASIRTLRRQTSARRSWSTLAAAAIVAGILLVPLFFSHPADVSLLAVARREHGGMLLPALAAQLAAVLGMFLLRGDPSLLHNRSGLPVFDPLSGLFFVLGTAVLMASWRFATENKDGTARARLGPRQDAAALVGLWLAIMLLPTLLSDRPPNFSRAIAALPAIVALPALGLAFACRTWWRQRCRAVAGAALSLALAWTIAQYFVAFGGRTPAIERSYDRPIMSAYTALEALSGDGAVFLMPVWAEHATFAYLNRHGPVRSFDASDAWLLPAGASRTVNAFPHRERDLANWLKEAGRVYGYAGRKFEIADESDQPLLVAYEVLAAAAGDMKPPRDAPLEPEHWAGGLFGEAIELVGYRYGETAPGELLPIIMTWRARRPISNDWTLFVHLKDEMGQSLGQSDERPANGSYPTSHWQAGDLLIDRAIPRLSAQARGVVRITVGWYDPATGERLPVNGTTEFELVPLRLDDGPHALASVALRLGAGRVAANGGNEGDQAGGATHRRRREDRDTEPGKWEPRP